MKKINWGTLVSSLVIPLAVGGAAALITDAGAGFYDEVTQPPLSPPSWVFSVVWTILYILMGVSLYLVRTSGGGNKRRAYVLFGAQLAVSLIWSIVFFNARAFLAASVIIVLLWALILAMVVVFRSVRPAAGYLQFPDFFWVTFAAYLTWSIYYLN